MNQRQAEQSINQSNHYSTSLSSNPKKCTLLLSDGSEFVGELVGVEGVATGEVIFNTAMSGYQEIITDPSYARQLICFTSSHIGNVGVNQYSLHTFLFQCLDSL